MATDRQTDVLRHLRRLTCSQPGAEVTDAQLVELFIATRDEEAFAAIVRRHGPMVLAVCRRVLGNEHDAEDAFQATFLVLARKAARLRHRNLVGNWLYGVAYRAALEIKAGRPKERPVSALPEPEVNDACPWSDLRPVLDAELSRLPATGRTAVVLCDLEGRTRREVARQLGIAESTLSSRLTAARRTLAKRLSRRGIVLSTTALATALSNTASASLPPSLVLSTAKTAAAVAAGSMAAVSVKVAAVMKGVLKTMFLAKLKIATAIFAFCACLALTVGILVSQREAGAQETTRQPEVRKVTPAVDQPKVYEAAGAKFQVAVVLDQPTIMLGEPTFFRFRVNNTSNVNLRMMVGSDYRNRLGRPESFKIDVVDSEGRKVSQPDAGATMGGLGGPAKLRANGHYDFSLFLPHWATFKEPGTYTITCRRKLEILPGGGDDPINPKTDDVETIAKATITVVPADHKKFGELIDKLGTQMLDRKTEGFEEAEKMLTAIHDERVVPYFVKLADKPHQSPRMAACGPLGRYKSDEAFAALKKLMTTTAAEVRDGSTTWELAESSADGVHHS